jgi:photosystem II stability/assembly factor-like uncharacterized protein
MFDENRGWASDTSGHVYKTTSGVQGWQDVTPTGAYAGLRSSLFFLDENIAFITVASGTPGRAQFFTLSSMDGGQSWQSGSPLTFASPPGDFWPIRMFFLNAEIGWLLGYVPAGMSHIDTLLYKTSNSGMTWEKVEDSYQALHEHQPQQLLGSSIAPFGKDNSMSFANPGRGYIGDYESLDGGQTWQKPALDSIPAGLIDLRSTPWFSSARDGVYLLRSYRKDQVVMPPGDIYQGLPQAQKLYRTQDGGLTWQPNLLPEKLGTVFFLDGRTGWFLGQSADSVNAAAKIYFSSDGGDLWELVCDHCPVPLGSKLQFVSARIGFATNSFTDSQNPYHSFDQKADSRPYLWVTMDGGANWRELVPMIMP